MLGAFHAENFPVKWDEKVDWAFDDDWEKRKVYVVEGISKLPAVRLLEARALHRQGDVGHPVLRHLRPRRASSGRSGSTTSASGRRCRANNAITYDDEMRFAPAIVMVDMQLEHATKASLPSPRFPGEQGWYFNQGEKAGVTDDWFTVAALVAAGH